MEFLLDALEAAAGVYVGFIGANATLAGLVKYLQNKQRKAAVAAFAKFQEEALKQANARADTPTE